MVWISIVAWLIMMITLGGVIQVLWEIKKELGNRPTRRRTVPTVDTEPKGGKDGKTD